MVSCLGRVGFSAWVRPYWLQRAYGVTVRVFPAPKLLIATIPTAVHVAVPLGEDDTSTALSLLVPVSVVSTCAPPPRSTFPEAHDTVAVICVPRVAAGAEVTAVPTTRVLPEGPVAPWVPWAPVLP